MGGSRVTEASALEGSQPLTQKIERARVELLDLSPRNRLLNTPRSGKARIIEVVNELATAMYKTLVVEQKRFTFAPARMSPSDVGSTDPLSPESLSASAEAANGGGTPSESVVPDTSLAQPDTELDAQGRIASQWDDRLSTRMTSAGLQKRLLDLYIDARTLQEEQGVNILYLAIGYLKWRDPQPPQTDRYAPLVLVPVVLERSTAGERFHLRWSGDDIEANLSLQAFLRRAHALDLPDIEDFESLDIDAYLASVATLVARQEHWEVLPNDAVLGLFSFAKFMMYRDLDPELWAGNGGFDSRETLRKVVSEGFATTDRLDDDAPIDPLIAPQDMLHVMDCDSSQSLVVHDARRGHHLLVQGPPGTGKSQTISNIIAAAVADGKTVLFVAEKMAALEVVKRRLDHVGVGVACLELHSHKANKRALLEELKQTWQLGRPREEPTGALIEQLTGTRDALNAHASELHSLHEPSNLSPYQVIGHLVRLKRAGHSTRQFALHEPATWAPHQKDERAALIRDLAVRIGTMGTPKEHAWFGVGIESVLPNDRDRCIVDIAGLSEHLDKWQKAVAPLCERLDLPPPVHLMDIKQARSRAQILLDAPRMGAEALRSPLWTDASSIQALIEAVDQARNLRDQVKGVAPLTVLSIDWTPHAASLTQLPGTFNEFAPVARASELLAKTRADVLRLAQLLQENTPPTLDSAQRCVTMAQHAASMPALERDSLVSSIWDGGLDAVTELIEAVGAVQRARETLASVFREAAWTTDLTEARQHEALLGTHWLRFLNGAWRRANRLIQSVCVAPKQLRQEQRLQALDQLIAAQAAQKRIAERNDLGRGAFGAHWEGERSRTDFLHSVVEWMHSLRPLNAGPTASSGSGSSAIRQRLADLADRELAVDIGQRLQPQLQELRTLLSSLHEGFLAAQQSPWQNAETLIGRVPFAELTERTTAWTLAHQHCRSFEGPVGELLEHIEVIRRTQSAVQTVGTISPQGQAAFGVLWASVESDPAVLRQAQTWMASHATLRELAARTSNPIQLLDAAEKAVAHAERRLVQLRDLFTRLQFEGHHTVPKEPVQATVDGLKAQLIRWQQNPEGLPQWVAYRAQANDGRRKGLAPLIDALETGHIPPEAALGAFELSYYEAILGAQCAAWPDLAKFDGTQHSQRVAHFAELDRRRIRQSVFEVLKAHHRQIPPTGGVVGPTSILRGEMARQRRHMPIRQLMQRCAPAVQSLKPVFMMSPLSVAQFLPPGALEFDLLVIDEASQVQPVDALGAIARAKQLVIVGDERQLPPTKFFARVLADEREDEEEGASAADIESILGFCRARGLPERMLRWHYRSRHHSLIAVSNSQFYNDRLFIVPSPFNSEAGMGLRLHHDPQHVYDRGKTSTNSQEAMAVARAVLEHARHSANLSLGVASFSSQQRRAITDALELLRRQHPETESFFAAHPTEPFFVKSLESIQGDERDVIFISVGYGRDAEGQPSMNFGPLNKEGGERRLNVLISRAKRRCEIFSPITDEDIDLERAKGRGIAAFKLFLHYARTGRLNLRPSEEAAPPNVFTQQVAEALKERNYHVHSDIGTAGCFIDLAVADPAHPGRYILGIECDGPSYHRARSARDRDRLRQSVLEDQGWALHRIWSSDWFHRPQSELDRLIAAIERARADLQSPAKAAAPLSRPSAVNVESVERGDFIEVSLVKSEAGASEDKYEEADFKTQQTRVELHLVPSGQMAAIVERVVGIEGPIHRDEVISRVRSLWGLQRAGGRIQASVDAGIDHAIAARRLELRDEDFLTAPGQGTRVRDRSEVSSQTLRKPEYLPPSEIDAAVRQTLIENLGASPDELITCVSRKFGYRSTSSQLRDVIDARVQHLIQSGNLQRRGEHIALPET